MTAEAVEFEQKLSALLHREVPGFEDLEAVRRLTAGASQESYRLDAVVSGTPRVMALRRVQAAQANAPAVISSTVEARLMQLAVAGGVPGPEVLYVLGEDDDLGEGFLMSWVEGESLGHRITHGAQFAEVRPLLARQCGTELARIHALDYRAHALEAVLPEVTPSALVEQTWQDYCELDTPAPMIDYSRRWLLDHLPQAPTTALVHGDYRNGNLMVGPQGITAVLDWELAHLGDPVRDLGWLCVNSWRFGRADLKVGGFGDVDDLLAGYEAASGTRVCRDHLHFWEVFGSFWWAVTCLRMAQSWRSGEAPSLERPAIGRRSSEAQMDCINLLIPGAFTVPQYDEGNVAGGQLPTAGELLLAVEQFLRDEVAPGSGSRQRFLATVGANSLAIARRESALQPSLERAEAERLHTLLGQSGELDDLRWALVGRLRDNYPLDSQGLASHLRLSVAGQLAIDQPGYSALKGAR